MKVVKHWLSKQNPLLRINVNPEAPYFEVKSAKVNYQNPDMTIGDLGEVKITVSLPGGKSEFYGVRLNNGIGSSLDDLERYFKIYDHPDASHITMELVTDFNVEILTVEIDVQLEHKPIDIKKPWTDFNAHISNPVNSKILFSAPFGQGKTTFLREFFNQERDQYDPFFIFPVNYSVATNDDIFRYIKADLLYQLAVDKEMVFDKLEASYLKTIPTFVKKNPDKILAPFLMLVPEIGKNLFSFYEKFKNVTDSFVDLHEEEPKDDTVASGNFLAELIEKEGSIYDDNLITKIIRQQIKNVKRNSAKKTVLVIDDLDRLDPEHTFRILNIISAHYDTYHTTVEGDYNKFGFDKIIVVCDINNIKNIFEHRYGARTNFSGYINKFYSTSHFTYDNKKVISALADGLIDFELRENAHKIYLSGLKCIFELLVSGDQMALRDLLKFQRFSLDSHVRAIEKCYVQGYYQFRYGLCTPIIGLLGDLYEEGVLLAMIENCRLRGNIANRRIQRETCWRLLAAISNNTGNDNQKGPYEFDVEREFYSLVLKDDFMTSILGVIEAKINNVQVDILTHNFGIGDLCDFLSENVRWYFRMKKSWEHQQN